MWGDFLLFGDLLKPRLGQPELSTRERVPLMVALARFPLTLPLGPPRTDCQYQVRVKVKDRSRPIRASPLLGRALGMITDGLGVQALKGPLSKLDDVGHAVGSGRS